MDEPRVYEPFISIQQAKQQGLKFYFTGIACKQGHIDLRVVSQHCCWICKKESGLNTIREPIHLSINIALASNLYVHNVGERQLSVNYPLRREVPVK